MVATKWGKITLTEMAIFKMVNADIPLQTSQFPRLKLQGKPGPAPERTGQKWVGLVEVHDQEAHGLHPW